MNFTNTIENFIFLFFFLFIQVKGSKIRDSFLVESGGAFFQDTGEICNFHCETGRFLKFLARQKHIFRNFRSVWLLKMLNFLFWYEYLSSKYYSIYKQICKIFGLNVKDKFPPNKNYLPRY